MPKLLVRKEDNLIVAITEKVEVVPNGIETDNFILAIEVDEKGAFKQSPSDIYDVIEIEDPSVLADVRAGYHCYIDGKFVPRQDGYIPPEELQRMLDDAIALLMETGLM